MEQKLEVSFHIAKRLIDVVVSFCLLIVLLPMLLAIAVLVKLDSPGPVFYLNERMGKDGRPFTLFKFRTMYYGSPPLHAADGSMLVLDDDPRVTQAGRLLRSGFDELPQLVNVLLGQMSLIGPRADPAAALATYRGIEGNRLRVKPGISGLAQVNGRTRLSLTQRHRFDLAYIEKQSSRLDTCIFLLTFFELLPLSRWGGHRLHERLNRAANRLISDAA